jgi:tRNA acetyltransferase TAN1
LQFFEELVQGKDSGIKFSEAPSKPLNKKIKFTYSDSSSSDDDDGKKEEGENEEHGEEEEVVNEENKSDTRRDDDGSHDNPISNTSDLQNKDENKTEENTKDRKEDSASKEISANEVEEPPAKKQCLGTDSSKSMISEKVEEKSIDKLIDDELQELKDKSKVRATKVHSIYD